MFDDIDLRPGERILWTGASRDARLVDAMDHRRALQVFFMFVIGVVLTLLLGLPSILPPIMIAFGSIGLVVQGVQGISQHHLLGHGRYAVTSQRVVVVYEGTKPTIVQADLAALGPPLVQVDPDGVGTIAFDRSPILRNGRWPAGGGNVPQLDGAPFLYRVTEPQQVGDLIFAQQEAATTEVD